MKTLQARLNWIRPVAKKIGISRIADVTMLDSIGLPVYQAIRPLSKNYKVSQGKGITKEQAEMSAIMESVEMYHAETPQVAMTAAYAEVVESLSYNLNALEKTKNITILPHAYLEWVEAENLITGQREYIPKEVVSMDFTIRPSLMMAGFRRTSNGLASGYTREEALLHGLHEVIERDCLSSSPRFAVEQQSLPESVRTLLQMAAGSGCSILLWYLPNRYGRACFEAKLYRPEQNVVYHGAGCHGQVEVAMIKAVTEAIQARLTMITGSRDDLRTYSYSQLRNPGKMQVPEEPEEMISPQHIPELPSLSPDQELQALLDVVAQESRSQPLAVNLTQSHLHVPVYFVVVPAMEFKVRH